MLWNRTGIHNSEIQPGIYSPRDVQIYSPEEECRRDILQFYEYLQNVINSVSNNDSTILARDFNTRVVDVPIEK